jgi:hypothetical protein
VCGTLLSAQAPNLVYQNRGRYSEGIRTAPSTGASLDLIAALVDYHESYVSLPVTFHASFYLPSRDDVFLTIREAHPRYFYWLDRVQPESAWAIGLNRFDWTTEPVIHSLNWRDRPLALDDLAATARLGAASPGRVERVLPVVLFHARLPTAVDAYAFAFRPTARVRLKFDVLRNDGGRSVLDSQTFPRVDANAPQWVKWRAGNWPDGWYRLLITGYSFLDGAEINQEVHFYHLRQFVP